MKRVVLTGASGFVGANLARRLLREGYDVHAILRPEHKSWRIQDISNELCIYSVNLIDREGLESAIRQARPDFVFHLAAHGAYSEQDNFQDIANANIMGTANLLDACLNTGFEVFVNAGSSSEYGFQEKAPTEQGLAVPNSTYAWAKLSATLWCGLAARQNAQRIHTLRLYSVYGPWEEPTRLVPTLITKGLQGTLPALVNPDIARDFIHTEDVENAFLTVANTAGLPNDAIYNVCTGKETKLRDIVEITRELLSIDETPDWGSMQQRQWDTNRWVGTARRLMNDTDWQPKITLETGMEKTIKWLRDPPNYGYYE